MESAAGEAAARLLCTDANRSRLDAAAVRSLPTALARLVLRRALTDRAAGRPVSFAHVDDALRLARDGGPAVDLPGQRLERIGPDVVLTSRPLGKRRDRGNRENPENLFWYPLSIPGEVRLGDAGWSVTAERASTAAAAGAAQVHEGAEGAMAVVRLDRLEGPLAVRNRRPGDRFRPLGLGGGKKLQDFFVDRKVARQTRDGVPLVVDHSDRIVWVGGHAIDERFRVTDPAQAVVVLRLRQV